jgi:hypothetical protein
MRYRSIALGILCVTFASRANAQSRAYPTPRVFGVLGDALAFGQGGAADNGNTFMQVMRASVVAQLIGTHGVDLTVARLQTIHPSGSRFTDLEFSNPEGDALILSYAGLNRGRAGGIPNEFSIGGGVIRRNTSDPDRTRDSWIGRVGYDSDALYRFDNHLDGVISFHVYFMDGRDKSVVYVVSLGAALRIG